MLGRFDVRKARLVLCRGLRRKHGAISALSSRRATSDRLELSLSRDKWLTAYSSRGESGGEKNMRDVEDEEESLVLTRESFNSSRPLLPIRLSFACEDRRSGGKCPGKSATRCLVEAFNSPECYVAVLTWLIQMYQVATLLCVICCSNRSASLFACLFWLYICQKGI